MEKNSLVVMVFEALCGLVCLGFGIYYVCVEDATKAVVFLVVGAVSLVMAVRAFIKLLKEKKDKDKKNKQ